MPTSTEVVHRVFDDKEGVFIEVGPDADGTGGVEIRTVGKPSIDWFGPLQVTFSPEFATALGKALIVVAQLNAE